MQVYAENKKAGYDYEILEKFTAGLSLVGQEVKSIRNGQMALTGAYVDFIEGKPELVGTKIPAYQPNNIPQKAYAIERWRRLLLTKKEINYLVGRTQQKGFSLIPLKVFDNNGRIKLEFALARGKKKHDKRETIKKKDLRRDIQKELGA